MRHPDQAVFRIVGQSPGLDHVEMKQAIRVRCPVYEEPKGGRAARVLAGASTGAPPLAILAFRRCPPDVGGWPAVIGELEMPLSAPALRRALRETMRDPAFRALPAPQRERIVRARLKAITRAVQRQFG